MHRALWKRGALKGVKKRLIIDISDDTGSSRLIESQPQQTEMPLKVQRCADESQAWEQPKPPRTIGAHLAVAAANALLADDLHRGLQRIVDFSSSEEDDEEEEDAPPPSLLVKARSEVPENELPEPEMVGADQDVPPPALPRPSTPPESNDHPGADPVRAGIDLPPPKVAKHNERSTCVSERRWLFWRPSIPAGGVGLDANEKNTCASELGSQLYNEVQRCANESQRIASAAYTSAKHGLRAGIAAYVSAIGAP